MTDRRYRAILIGNSRFAHEPHLADLEGPANDVPLMFAAITDERRGLFKPDDVRRLPERPIQELREEIEGFFADATRNDVLVFYYSGHGVRNANNQLFLCAADTVLARMNATALGSRWLNDAMSDSAAKTIVVVLDCCHSGAFKDADISSPLAGTGRFVLTSSRATQLTPDTVDRNAPSLFTRHLTQGLAGAAAIGAEISIHELYQYVYGKMSGYGQAEPQFHTEGAGELTIARGNGPVAAVLAPLTLSSTGIRFADTVPAGSRPPNSRVFVRTDPNGPADWRAGSPTEWVTVRPDDGYFDVSLDPPPGRHLAYVYVHDRISGTVVELPIEVTVAAAAAVLPQQPVPVPASPPDAEPAEIPAVGQASISDPEVFQIDAGLSVSTSWPTPMTQYARDLATRAGERATSHGANTPQSPTAQADAEPPRAPRFVTASAIADAIRVSTVPDLLLTPADSGPLRRARTNAGVSTNEETVAFLHVGAYQSVLFTNTGVYWSDNYASSACRYVDFPRKRFESPTPTHVTFGDGVPRPVGAKHAKQLAQLLNNIRAYVDVLS